MNTNERHALMDEVKNMIIQYLQEEKEICEAALRQYDSYDSPMQDADQEIKKMREVEAMKLRNNIHELNRHIAVIRRMVPPIKNTSADRKSKS